MSPSIEEASQERRETIPSGDLPDSFSVRTELVFKVDAVPTSFDAFVDTTNGLHVLRSGPSS